MEQLVPWYPLSEAVREMLSLSTGALPHNKRSSALLAAPAWMLTTWQALRHWWMARDKAHENPFFDCWVTQLSGFSCSFSRSLTGLAWRPLWFLKFPTEHLLLAIPDGDLGSTPQRECSVSACLDPQPALKYPGPARKVSSNHVTYYNPCLKGALVSLPMLQWMAPYPCAYR